MPLLTFFIAKAEVFPPLKVFSSLLIMALLESAIDVCKKKFDAKLKNRDTKMKGEKKYL